MSIEIKVLKGSLTIYEAKYAEEFEAMADRFFLGMLGSSEQQRIDISNKSRSKDHIRILAMNEGKVIGGLKIIERVRGNDYTEKIIDNFKNHLSFDITKNILGNKFHELDSIIVKDSSRGQGISKSLKTKAFDVLEELNAELIIGYLYNVNKRAATSIAETLKIPYLLNHDSFLNNVEKLQTIIYMPKEKEDLASKVTDPENWKVFNPDSKFRSPF